MGRHTRGIQRQSRISYDPSRQSGIDYNEQRAYDEGMQQAQQQAQVQAENDRLTLQAQRYADAMDEEKKAAEEYANRPDIDLGQLDSTSAEEIGEHERAKHQFLPMAGNLIEQEEGLDPTLRTGLSIAANVVQDIILGSNPVTGIPWSVANLTQSVMNFQDDPSLTNIGMIVADSFFTALSIVPFLGEIGAFFHASIDTGRAEARAAARAAQQAAARAAAEAARQTRQAAITAIESIREAKFTAKSVLQRARQAMTNARESFFATKAEQKGYTQLGQSQFAIADRPGERVYTSATYEARLGARQAKRVRIKSFERPPRVTEMRRGGYASLVPSERMRPSQPHERIYASAHHEAQLAHQEASATASLDRQDPVSISKRLFSSYQNHRIKVNSALAASEAVYQAFKDTHVENPYHSDAPSVHPEVPIPGKVLAMAANNAYESDPTQAALDGYELLKKTDTLTIYKQGRNILVSIRGTADKRDAAADLLIPMGALGQSDRFKADFNDLQEFQKQYSPKAFNYLGVGHSLGGAVLDEFLKRKMINAGASFNAAVQPFDVRNEAIKNRRIYDKDDPLYMLMGRFTANPYVIPHRPDLIERLSKIPNLPGGAITEAGKFGYNKLRAHKLDNFL